MRRYFARRHQEAGLEFVATEFKHSFRSGPNVLKAVDAVFAPAEAHKGLTAQQAAPVHEWLPDAAPGLVEIWDLEKSDDIEAKEGWAAPLDTQTVTSGTVRLARRIAGSVVAWRRQGRLAKDVLILVRRRGALFEAIIRALKNQGIPVAGADRLVLTEHIAVMDLMTLADALLLPEDDLALATVLRSPLFGLSDDDLFKLAWNRQGSLLGSLRAQRPDVATEINAIADAARADTPFAFYAGLLGARGGRRKILARLGHEAADALDEFLNLALDYERRETPSLQGFVSWLRNAQAEVKRDMELARDEVRVMTVHGAKGLEAPIVILADTTTPPQGWHPPRLLSLPAQNAAPETPGQAIWAGRRKPTTSGRWPTAREMALDGARDEYRRLLYVAMTRAIDRLIVCGIDTGRKLPDGCWYELVRNALEAGERKGESGLRRRGGVALSQDRWSHPRRQNSKPAAAAPRVDDTALADAPCRKRIGAAQHHQAVGLRRRSRDPRADGAGRSPRARHCARPCGASADAIAAGCASQSARRNRAAIFRTAG